MQITLEKKKSVKSELEVKAGAGARDMKEDDIVDESELAVYSTLNKEGEVFNEQTGQILASPVLDS